MDFLVHYNIVLHKGDFLAVFAQETFQNGRSLLRTAEVDTLRGIHQFNGKDMFQIDIDAEVLRLRDELSTTNSEA
jgi:hypothetical protein